MFIEVRMSSIAFSKENVKKGRDVGDGIDADLYTLGGVKILAGRLIAGAVVGRASLYGILNKKSSDKIFEGK